MVTHLIMNGEDLIGWGSQLLRSASNARSYDGQYAPWVQAMADQADHDLRILSEEVDELGLWTAHVATGFEEADAAEARGFGEWAALIRSMVEQGLDPVGLMPVWARTLGRPPWIDQADWRDMSWEQRQQIIREYQQAWMEQQARIDRLTTPPWERDERWLWAVAGINPDLAGLDGMLEPGEIREIKDQLVLTRQEYERKWAEFLESQSLYKFGVGDDLSEAFLIYLFGLEGAAAYGLNVHVAPDGTATGGVSSQSQRVLQDYQFERLSGGNHAQDINLNLIEGFRGKGYGINSGDLAGVHYNLCGEIVASVTAGVDPVDGLIAFEQTSRGAEILGDHTVGTNSNELIDLLQEYGWEGERLGNAGDPYPWSDDRGWEPKPDQVGDHLQEGRAVIALVNLEKLNAFVEPVDGRNDATHWVSILQVVTGSDGAASVRIFNPYENREEWYSFDHLVESWTPGPNYRAVVATPPADQAWLASP
jgi:hypothetical protein